MATCLGWVRLDEDAGVDQGAENLQAEKKKQHVFVGFKAEMVCTSSAGACLQKSSSALRMFKQ
jgi:hypothetical protein